jgi:two-component system cell cycle sensor histidine kinase/response regulator CckA
MLKRLGFEVDFASNGEETLQKYPKGGYDLVIMDLTIQGGLGGAATMSRLLVMDPDAKVIVSSGYSNDPVMADFKKHGFIGVIVKPYRIDELISILRDVLR